MRVGQHGECDASFHGELLQRLRQPPLAGLDDHQLGGCVRIEPLPQAVDERRRIGVRRVVQRHVVDRDAALGERGRVVPHRRQE